MIKKCIFTLTMLAAAAGIHSHLQAAQGSNIQELATLSDAGVQPQNLKAYLEKNAPDLIKFVAAAPTRLDVQLYTSIVQANKPVLVKFYLKNCGPCKEMGKVVERVAKKLGDSILVINIEHNDTTSSLMKPFDAHGVPTLVFFKDNKKVWQFTGNLNDAQLTEKLK